VPEAKKSREQAKNGTSSPNKRRKTASDSYTWDEVYVEIEEIDYKGPDDNQEASSSGEKSQWNASANDKRVLHNFLLDPTKTDPALWTAVKNDVDKHENDKATDPIIAKLDEHCRKASRRKANGTAGIRSSMDARTLELCDEFWELQAAAAGRNKLWSDPAAFYRALYHIMMAHGYFTDELTYTKPKCAYGAALTCIAKTGLYLTFDQLGMMLAKVKVQSLNNYEYMIERKKDRNHDAGPGVLFVQQIGCPNPQPYTFEKFCVSDGCCAFPSTCQKFVKEHGSIADYLAGPLGNTFHAAMVRVHLKTQQTPVNEWEVFADVGRCIGRWSHANHRPTGNKNNKTSDEPTDCKGSGTCLGMAFLVMVGDKAVMHREMKTGDLLAALA